METNTVILNCPYCGKAATTFDHEDWPEGRSRPENAHGIGCDTADCYGSKDADMAYFDSTQEAIESWNKRHKQGENK